MSEDKQLGNNLNIQTNKKNYDGFYIYIVGEDALPPFSDSYYRKRNKTDHQLCLSSMLVPGQMFCLISFS